MNTVNLEIVPCSTPGPCRTGHLAFASVQLIKEVLGFDCNVKDDPYKVKHSWGFTVNGELCGIWDYKGSEKQGFFSTYGPKEILSKLFPNNFNK